MEALTPVKPLFINKPQWETLPVAVINMDKDVQKWQDSRQVLENLGTKNVSRFPAIVGKNVKLDNENIGVYGKLFSEKGVIGAGLSHRALWRYALDSSLDYFMICEDDIFLDTDPVYAKRYIEKALEELPANFDILYLGHFGVVGSETEVGTLMVDTLKYLPGWSRRKYRRISQRINEPAYPIGVHAYIISKKFCRKIFRDLPKLVTFGDLDLARVAIKKNYKVYALERRIIHQSSILGKVESCSSTGSGSNWQLKLAKALTTEKFLQYEPDINATMNFSVGSIRTWKFGGYISVMTLLISVVVGVLTTAVNYGYVIAGFTVLNSTDFFFRFQADTSYTVTGNTIIAAIGAMIGRLLTGNTSFR